MTFALKHSCGFCWLKTRMRRFEQWELVSYCVQSLVSNSAFWVWLHFVQEILLWVGMPAKVVPCRVKQESLVNKAAQGEGFVFTDVSCWFVFSAGEVFWTWLYLSTEGWLQVPKHGHPHEKILGYLLDILRYLKIKSV